MCPMRRDHHDVSVLVVSQLSLDDPGVKSRRWPSPSIRLCAEHILLFKYVPGSAITNDLAPLVPCLYQRLRAEGRESCNDSTTSELSRCPAVKVIDEESIR